MRANRRAAPAAPEALRAPHAPAGAAALPPPPDGLRLPLLFLAFFLCGPWSAASPSKPPPPSLSGRLWAARRCDSAAGSSSTIASSAAGGSGALAAALLRLAGAGLAPPCWSRAGLAGLLAAGASAAGSSSGLPSGSASSCDSLCRVCRTPGRRQPQLQQRRSPAPLRCCGCCPARTGLLLSQAGVPLPVLVLT